MNPCNYFQFLSLCENGILKLWTFENILNYFNDGK